jgi:hypothetical protein
MLLHVFNTVKFEKWPVDFHSRRKITTGKLLDFYWWLKLKLSPAATGLGYTLFGIDL